MKLISENFSDEVEYITEEQENGKKNFKLKGVFMQAEIKNRNGRVYPMDVLEKEVARIKDEMERNVRSRKANYQALAFAKFLKKL